MLIVANCVADMVSVIAVVVFELRSLSLFLLVCTWSLCWCCSCRVGLVRLVPWFAALMWRECVCVSRVVRVAVAIVVVLVGLASVGVVVVAFLDWSLLLRWCVLKIWY